MRNPDTAPARARMRAYGPDRPPSDDDVGCALALLVALVLAFLSGWFIGG